MPSTYIDLCNKTLRRLNEVEISADNFPSVRGVQALVKDAVKRLSLKLTKLNMVGLLTLQNTHKS